MFASEAAFHHALCLGSSVAVAGLLGYPVYAFLSLAFVYHDLYPVNFVSVSVLIYLAHDVHILVFLDCLCFYLFFCSHPVYHLLAMWAMAVPFYYHVVYYHHPFEEDLGVEGLVGHGGLDDIEVHVVLDGHGGPEDCDDPEDLEAHAVHVGLGSHVGLVDHEDREDREDLDVEGLVD